MWQNTKALLIVSSLIIFSGFGFLWLGLKPVSNSSPVPTSVPQLSALIVTDNSSQATESATQGVMGEKVLVTQVVDGDTIKVLFEGKEKTVRFVGMDTPETVDPRRPVGCFGKEASNETKNLLSGREVILQKDVSESDKYGRILRYIYLPLDNGQILFVNDYLVREGFAKVYTYPPDVKFNEQFLQAEKQAREFKRGLWGKC